jgi:hypothetical protein
VTALLTSVQARGRSQRGADLFAGSQPQDMRALRTRIACLCWGQQSFPTTFVVPTVAAVGGILSRTERRAEMSRLLGPIFADA